MFGLTVIEADEAEEEAVPVPEDSDEMPIQDTGNTLWYYVEDLLVWVHYDDNEQRMCSAVSFTVDILLFTDIYFHCLWSQNHFYTLNSYI